MTSNRSNPPCFHGQRNCRFCGDWHYRTPLGVMKRKPRCPTCGRFTRRHDRCSRCVERGFLALTLF